MSNIRINSFPTRKQYTYAGGAKIFVIDFPFFENEDIFVYVGDPANNYEQEDPHNLLTYGSDYTLTGAGLATGGQVLIDDGVDLQVGFTVTVVGRMVIDRFSILETTSAITRAQYNEDMNRLTCMIQQINTIVEQTMPKYDRSEIVNTSRNDIDTPFSYVNLPLLRQGYTWVGNEAETGLTTFFLGLGAGFVTAAHAGMQPSIALWTGTDFVLTDSLINIVGTDFVPLNAGDVIGIDDTAGAFGWPAHSTADRPVAPENGDVYYDTDLGGYYGFFGGTWQRFSFGSAGNVVSETIMQANDFDPGEIIRRNKDTNLYVRAQADSEENAEVCGIVIAASATSFDIQYIGRVNIAGAGWTDGRVFFLDPVTPGALTLVEPTTNGQVSKPLVIATATDSGIFFNFRGVIITDGEDVDEGEEIIIKTITQPGHGFVMTGFVVKPDPANSGEYIAADSVTSLNTATGVGMIRIIDVDHFTIQQVGYMDDLDVPAPVPGGVANSATPFTFGQTYYLDPANPGELTDTAPTTPNYEKPCYSPDTIKGGWVLPMKPSVVGGGGGGGANGGLFIIDTYNFNNEDNHEFTNIFDGTYTIAEIVGQDLIFASATNFFYRVETEDGIISTGNYRNISANAGNAAFGMATGSTAGTVNNFNGNSGTWLSGVADGVINDNNKFSFRMRMIGLYTNDAFKLFEQHSFGLVRNATNRYNYYRSNTAMSVPKPLTGIAFYASGATGVGVPVNIVSGTITIYGTKITP